MQAILYSLAVLSVYLRANTSFAQPQILVLLPTKLIPKYLAGYCKYFKIILALSMVVAEYMDFSGCKRQVVQLNKSKTRRSSLSRNYLGRFLYFENEDGNLSQL